jgi:hypothetical protein
MIRVMRKVIIPLVLLVWVAGAAAADTLYLKNGSVMNGTFITFENGKFVMDVAEGNRVEISVDRVSRLVIDRDAIYRGSRRDNYPRRDSDNLSYSRDSSGREWGKAEPFDVRLQDQWKHSQIQVTRGQRVRVEASGTLTLGSRTTIGPDGLSGQRDSDAPMYNENDGALIASIGQSFDSPMILIGRSREFVADRDGMLYFAVNHSGTGSSRGSFLVNVSLERGSGSTSGYRRQQREKSITISAGQAWTDTGIDIDPSTTIEIVAEGQINVDRNRPAGPDGEFNNLNLGKSTFPVPNKGAGALIARVRYSDGRNSKALFIGSRGFIKPETNESGRLYIGINDDYLQDNTGSYRVTIRW